ncbi:hypothetical protein [Pseudomonas sp. DWP3-1-2]|uniref:hypothetical protein n=1 Tax=Pseudomonas sp. DWP3-1-2 TaxID=2804645 RepID=UPI003CF4609E
MPLSNRRELNVSMPPLKLIACIALGIWLGIAAAVLTGVLVFRALPEAQTQAVSNAAVRLSTPATVPAESEKTMFEHYEQNLRESEARQAMEQTREQQQKTFNAPKCNFWLQQDRTAPSDKSRANVMQFCG